MSQMLEEAAPRREPMRYFRVSYTREELEADGEERTVPMPAGGGTIDVEEVNERKAKRFITQFAEDGEITIDDCVEIDYLGGEPLEAPKKKKG